MPGSKRSARKPGYVYLLTNPSMPGLVKIGRTARDPRTRIRELASATGVPTPFKLEGHIWSPDASRTESAVHELIGDRRVSKRREFFRIEPTEAHVIVRSVADLERLRFRRPRRRVPSFAVFLSLATVLAVISAYLPHGMETFSRLLALAG